MIKKLNLYKILLFILLLNIFVVFVSSQQSCNSTNTILVNYNVPKNYSSFKDCGVNDDQVCISFEDAGNRAILLSKSFVCIEIISDINGSIPISFSNLYKFCGSLWITAKNTSVNINIDGSNSKQQPFLTIEQEVPDQSNSTDICQSRSFNFRYLNFINWYQTIAYVNIYQVLKFSINKPTTEINFVNSNIISSGSIVMVYPKNVGQIYHSESMILNFFSTIAYNLKTSGLLAPNSSTDKISPIHVVGGFLSNMLRVSNSTFLSTPFLYLEGGIVSPLLDFSVLNNNFSVNPFMMLIDSTFFFNGNINFKDNQLSTFIFISRYISSQINFNKIYFTNNTSNQLLYEKKKYLNYQYENSFAVVKDSYDFVISNFLIYNLNPNTTGNCLIFVENSKLTLQYSPPNFPIQVQHIFITINSSIALEVAYTNVSSLIPIELPIVGNYSQVNITLESININGIFCGCNDCDYYLLSSSFSEKINTTNYNCVNPTPTQTLTSIPTPTSTSTSISTSTYPKVSIRTRNIIIITVILGTVSTGSLIILSLVYRVYKNKKFIPNTPSTDEKSSGFNDNLYAVAEEDEKAVSPIIDLAVVSYEHGIDDDAEYD
ncbi:hypothetical protein RB653_000601 [Dictyostelium firmibasis]|uniref:Transmembrane protein n=1 Tax=Dictyostelium firmibasis TaxID=79012 RepID=A0AAN7YW24_9MYCE